MAKVDENQLRELRDAIGLENILAALDEIVWIASVADPTDVFYISPNFSAILGDTASDFSAHHMEWAEAVHTNDRERFLEHCREVATSGRSETLEYRIVARNGDNHWLRDRVSVVSLTNGSSLLLGAATVVDAEIELRSRIEDSERFNVEIFDLSPDPMYIYDFESLRFLVVNDAAVQFYGYSAEEFLEKTIMDIRPPAEQERLLDLMTSPHASQSHAGQWTHQQRDGALVLVDVWSRSLEFNGRPARIVLVRDLQQLVDARRALAEQEMWLHEAQSLTGSGWWRMNLVKGELEWSAQTYALFGFTDKDALPVPGDVVTKLVHPDDRQLVSDALAECRRTGVFPTTHHRILRADGTMREMMATGRAELNDSGECIAISGTIIDVTENYAAQRELLRIRRVVESSTDGILMMDTQGRLQYQNDAFAAVSGYPNIEELQEAGGLAALGLDPVVYEEMLAATSASQGFRKEVKLTGRAAGDLDVFLRADPVEDERGRQTGIVITLTNIGAEKRAREREENMQRRMMEAQRMESIALLAGGVAHDFNNLLAGVLGNAGLLAMDLKDGTPQREAAADIETAAVRMAELTRQLLAYAGKGQFVSSLVNVNSLVQEMVRLLRPTLPRHAIIEMELCKQAMVVHADSTQLRQVIMNLITNAGDALPPDTGTISLLTDFIHRDHLPRAVREACPDSQYMAMVEVRDTGCGMSDETRKRIFDPFFTTKVTGRGLGLAAVQGVVRLLHGYLDLESTEGVGTTFRIYLPARVGHGPDTSDAGEVSGAVDLSRGMNVLVIDDEDVVLSTVRNILTRSGHVVKTYSDGAEAVAEFQKDPEKYDLVLLDVIMPDMDGPAVLRQLQAVRPDLPAIMMSGFSHEAHADMLASSRLSGFLQKPFRPRDLVESVEKIQKAR